MAKIHGWLHKLTPALMCQGCLQIMPGWGPDLAVVPVEGSGNTETFCSL